MVLGLINGTSADQRDDQVIACRFGREDRISISQLFGTSWSARRSQ